MYELLEQTEHAWATACNVGHGRGDALLPRLATAVVNWRDLTPWGSYFCRLRGEISHYRAVNLLAGSERSFSTAATSVIDAESCNFCRRCGEISRYRATTSDATAEKA